MRALSLVATTTLIIAMLMAACQASSGGAPSAATANATADGLPRVCFDTILTIRPDLVAARQLQSQLCQLWNLNKRHVFGAQFNDDRTQISMVVTYPYATSLATSGTGGSSGGGGGSGSARPPVYLFETYNSASGARLSSVELKQASLPPMSRVDDTPVALCVTSGHIFLSVYGNGSSTIIQHFDRSGAKKPLLAYAQISASDRVWMSCTDSSVYISVPAANAVWRLSPSDGLLERIVARLQSPNALSIDYGMLRVASGRPAREIHTYDLYSSESHRGQVDISVESLHLRGISIVSPSPYLVAVVDDDGILRQLSDPLVNTVVANRNLAVRHAETMMADGRTAIVNGLPVFIKTGTPITAVSNSELLNAGNSDRVSTVLYTRDSRQLITVDQLGAVNMYSSFDHQCPIVFVKPLPPLLSTESSVIYTDERDWRTPLLYVAMDESTLVLRPSVADSDELVWPDFCPDVGETILTGVSTSWPVRVTCALCGAELVCLFDEGAERRIYPLPLAMIGSLNAVRLAWDGAHENVLAFHLGTDIWSLPIASGAQRNEASWSLLRQFSRLPVVFDITYWDVREIYADVYSLRLSADYILLVTGASGNWTATAGAPLDRNQALGNKLLMVPNVQTSYYDDQSICVGFPLNVTREDFSMTAGQRAAAIRDMWIALGGLIACLVICTSLCCVSALYRVTIVRMPWSKNHVDKPFSRLGSAEALQAPPSLWSRLKNKLPFVKDKYNELLLDEFEDLNSLNGAQARDMANRADPDQGGGHYTDVPIASAVTATSPSPPGSIGMAAAAAAPSRATPGEPPSYHPSSAI